MKLRDYLKTATGLIKIGSNTGFFFCGDVDLLNIDEIDAQYLGALINRRDRMMVTLRGAKSEAKFREYERLLEGYQHDIDNWVHMPDREIKDIRQSEVEDATIVIIEGDEFGELNFCGMYGDLDPTKTPDENAISLVSAIYKEIANALIDAYKRKAIAEELVELYTGLLEEQRNNILQADAIISAHERYFSKDPYNLLLKSDGAALECKKRAERDITKAKEKKRRLRTGGK